MAIYKYDMLHEYPHHRCCRWWVFFIASFQFLFVFLICPVKMTALACSFIFFFSRIENERELIPYAASSMISSNEGKSYQCWAMWCCFRSRVFISILCVLYDSHEPNHTTKLHSVLVISTLTIDLAEFLTLPWEYPFFSLHFERYIMCILFHS